MQVDSTRFPTAPLFVPAHVERQTDKAMTLKVDAVVLDLEDAVPTDQKSHARERAVAFIARKPGLAYVRINSMRSNALSYIVPCGEVDLLSIVIDGLRGIVLPKVESADDVIAIDAQLRVLERHRGLEPGSVQLLALVESAKGISQLTDIVRPRLSRPWCLCFGAGDFTSDLGVAWSASELESQTARSLIVLASAAAGLPPPIDSAYPDIANENAFRASALNAFTLGFQGKFAIHPSQVSLVEEQFRPSPSLIQWAGQVMDGYAKAQARGQGAFKVDGRMIDYPIVERARRVLQASQASR